MKINNSKIKKVTAISSVILVLIAILSLIACAICDLIGTNERSEFYIDIEFEINKLYQSTETYGICEEVEHQSEVVYNLMNNDIMKNIIMIDSDGKILHKQNEAFISGNSVNYQLVSHQSNYNYNYDKNYLYLTDDNNNILYSFLVNNNTKAVYRDSGAVYTHPVPTVLPTATPEIGNVEYGSDTVPLPTSKPQNNENTAQSSIIKSNIDESVSTNNPANIYYTRYKNFASKDIMTFILTDTDYLIMYNNPLCAIIRDVFSITAFIAALLFWLTLPFAVYFDAKERSNNPFLWFFVLIVTNVIGLVVYMFSPKLKYCPNCKKAVVSEDYLCCPSCGAKINNECECGTVLKPNTKFCHKCGKEIENL